MCTAVESASDFSLKLFWTTSSSPLSSLRRGFWWRWDYISPRVQPPNLWRRVSTFLCHHYFSPTYYNDTGTITLFSLCREGNYQLLGMHLLPHLRVIQILSSHLWATRINQCNYWSFSRHPGNVVLKHTQFDWKCTLTLEKPLFIPPSLGIKCEVEIRKLGVRGAH